MAWESFIGIVSFSYTHLLIAQRWKIQFHTPQLTMFQGYIIHMQYTSDWSHGLKLYDNPTYLFAQIYSFKKENILKLSYDLIQVFFFSFFLIQVLLQAYL